MFGKLDNPKNQKLEDLNSREIAIMVPLIFLIFFMGLYPKPFIDKMSPALDKVIAQTRLTKPVAAQPQMAPAMMPAEGQPGMMPQMPGAMPSGHPAMPGMPEGHPK